MKFSYIDLYAGIGGMRIGFDQACKELGHQSECIFSSEWDKWCKETYKDNFGELPHGDIHEITQNNINVIKKHDVLMAGFPCQPFSNAGLRKGFNDTRGTAFDDIKVILDIKRPKAFILENVKGLKSHDGGNTLKIILSVLRNELNYYVPDPQILNSKDFGLPQNRQRIFIVGFLKNNDFIYPKPVKIKTQVSHILKQGPKDKFKISERLWESHKKRKEKNMKNNKGFGYSRFFPKDSYTNTLSARYYKDGAEILIGRKNKEDDDKEGWIPRKLTPDEAKKLQGFPDEFIVSRSNIQAYKQFGNAVSVPVIKELSKEVIHNLIK